MARSKGEQQRQPGSVRCAIYTRKSTEEGLDQEFNSLDAQREACAAYILSQRHEGWTLLPGIFDDGGYSGGNMDRPGLKRLLAEVRAGNVDVVVVYKVDRLTRALSDFARIVETLDEAGASFVSITQAFNTTTSMGRLTLNVLLSFAQFEREVISERVRDKIAASKRKGIWMGGTVPLGYTVLDRKLIVNEAEAQTVRYIFERYLELRSVRALLEAMKQEGIRTKVQMMRDGSRRGGIPFARGPLYHLLKNPIYIGQLPHRKLTYPGQHEAIVSRELWEAVQDLLQENGAARTLGTNAAEPSVLTGMLRDELGRAMTASHATKGAKRYRYYVSVADGGPAAAERQPVRIPAGEIEKLVRLGVAKLLSGEGRVAAYLAAAGAEPAPIYQKVRAWSATAIRLPDLSPSEMRALYLKLDLQVIVRLEGVDATFDSGRLSGAEPACGNPRQVRSSIELPGTLVRRGHEVRLVFASDRGEEPSRDPRLIALLVKGYAARKELLATQEVGANPPFQTRKAHLCRLARVAYLAPDIVQAIMDGRQPRSLTSRQLLRAGELPIDWNVQRHWCGMPGH